MEPRKICIRFFILILAYSATTLFTLTDARRVVQFSNFQGPKFSRNSIHNPMGKPKLPSHIHKKIVISRAESNGLCTPFPLPSLGSLSPLSSPPNNIPAPFCIYPPSSPNFPLQSPPPSPTHVASSPPPSPTHAASSPPPSPTHAASSPPAVSPGLSPPEYVPSPPSSGIRTPPPHGPSPPKSIPSPPVVHPPPAGPPPPPHKKPQFAIWCVAKPSVPDTIIQEAMDYACGSGADCKAIQPNGLCFQPNTLFAHASYAFNSYWQNTKVGGGTCDFGGTAMLVTTDPSFDDCRFVYN